MKLRHGDCCDCPSCKIELQVGRLEQELAAPLPPHPPGEDAEDVADFLEQEAAWKEF